MQCVMKHKLSAVFICVSIFYFILGHGTVTDVHELYICINNVVVNFEHIN